MKTPRILPAGAESGRYIRLFKVAGWPNDYFYELSDAKKFAAARNAPISTVYGVDFYEEKQS